MFEAGICYSGLGQHQKPKSLHAVQVNQPAIADLSSCEIQNGQAGQIAQTLHARVVEVGPFQRQRRQTPLRSQVRQIGFCQSIAAKIQRLMLRHSQLT